MSASETIAWGVQYPQTGTWGAGWDHTGTSRREASVLHSSVRAVARALHRSEAF